MKNYLKETELWNTFPRNPIQTTYLRFMKKPQTGLDTEFIKMQNNFKKQLEQPEYLIKRILDEGGEIL